MEMGIPYVDERPMRLIILEKLGNCFQWLLDRPRMMQLSLFLVIVLCAFAGFGIADLVDASLGWVIVMTIVGLAIGTFLAIVLTFILVLIEAARPEDDYYG